MFLFGCCQLCTHFDKGVGYQLRRRSKPEDSMFVNSLKDIPPSQIYEDSFNIVKINKSQFDQLFNKLSSSKQVFTDQYFPPNQASLGNIEGKGKISWRRINDVIRNPTLFAEQVRPCQAIESTFKSCYFLSALATIAQKEDRIKKIFGDQTFNQLGIYKVLMQIDGIIEQVIIDDYLPVNKQDCPLFCKPFENIFWTLILEKAWAKVHGSYENINNGVAADVLRAFTFAPSGVLQIKNRNEQLWNTLCLYTSQSYPLCCLSSDKKANNGILPSYFYTLLSAVQLEDSEGVHHKIIKLRDRLGKSRWEGFGNQQDHSFWNKIAKKNQILAFQKQNGTKNLGIFYMTFNDFCDNFKQIHYSLQKKEINYFYQPINHDKNNKKSGKIFEVQILKQGQYSFGLHQSSKYQQNQKQKLMPQVCRTSILIINNNQGKYDFVNGKMKYNQENTTITEILKPGSYLIFIKIDPTKVTQLLPKKITLSVYSANYLNIQSTSKFKYQNLLKETFLRYAKNHKTNKLNKGTMWVSSQLLFAQGGYALIAFGNDQISHKKFIVDLSQEQFNNVNLKLKGEFKGVGNKTIQILPGQQQILLARVKNQTVSFLKFPPKIGIKTQLLPQ